MNNSHPQNVRTHQKRGDRNCRRNMGWYKNYTKYDNDARNY